VIGVLGATGRIGRHVASALADRPVEACALVRWPSAPDVPLPTVHADLTDRATLRQGLRGVERLLLVTPHGPDQDLFEAAAIDAAVAAGVRHVVKVSGGAASLGPNGTTATATAHWRSEQRLERSGLGFTFLRPSFFQQNLLETVAPAIATSGVLVAPFGHAPIAMVDVRDIAACAVAVLTDPDPDDQAWQLTGPRGATFDQIAAHLGVRYLPIPPKAAGRALARRGAPAAEVEHAVRMAAYFAAGSDAVPTDHVARLTGRPPRSVEAFLDEQRRHFVPATGLARTLSRTAHLGGAR
jgi:NAD(P)H dehydrogenase (quinone)